VQTLLAHPAFQVGIAPLLAAAIVAALGHPLRLSGLAPWAGLLAAVYLLGRFGLEPLTPTRRIILIAAAAPLFGLLADIAFKPSRSSAVMLGALFGVASLWVLVPALGERPVVQALIDAALAIAMVGFVVGASLTLRAEPARAGAAGLGLGLGVGLAALLAGSTLIARYGLAIGAASGGYLLALMLVGPRLAAGAALALSVSVGAGLLAAAAVFLGRLPSYIAVVLMLVPLSVWLPVPRRASAAAQAIVAALYALAPAAGACALAWTTFRLR